MKDSVGCFLWANIETSIDFLYFCKDKIQILNGFVIEFSTVLFLEEIDVFYK